MKLYRLWCLLMVSVGGACWWFLIVRHLDQDNVQTQLNDPSSFLSMTSSLLKLRKSLPSDLPYSSFDTGSSSVFGFTRGPKTMVLVNLGATAVSKVRLNPEELAYTVLHNSTDATTTSKCVHAEQGKIFMAPESAVVVRVGCAGMYNGTVDVWLWCFVAPCGGCV